MADVYTIGEPESSEDDSVSLTSTIESDEDGKTYDVDRILAESVEDGVTSYLTQWLGYPETRSTWQLINTFNDCNDVFKSWDEKKMRISRGYEKDFDIDAWETRRHQEIEKARTRRERRARTKAKLNRQIDSVSPDAEDKRGNISPAQTKKCNGKFVARGSSESSFEHDDAPLIARRDSANEASSASWTLEEHQAFIKGLQEANGPYWKDIMARHGHQGSIDRQLKNKSRKDMQVQLGALRKQFTDVGRDPPDYMSLPKTRPISEAPTRSKQRNRPQSRAQSREELDPHDSGTSSDSMLAEIMEKQSAKRSLTVRSPLRRPRPGSAPNSSPPKASNEETSLTVQLSPIAKVGPTVESSRPPHGKSSSVVDKSSKGEKAGPGAIGQPIERAEKAKQPYAGTARVAVSRTKPGDLKEPNRSRLGGAGSGPSRLPTSKQNIQLMSRSSGIDVTANWRTATEPKMKRTATLPTTTATSSSRPSGKLFNLQVRNIVQKGRKKEPAPSLSGVVLMDPRRKSMPALLDSNPVTNSPLQQFRKELAPKEAEGRHVNETEGTIVSREESLFVDNSGLFSDADIDELVHRESANAPKSSSPDNTDPMMVNETYPTSMPRSHPSPQPTRRPSQDRGAPLNAPAGPRVSTGMAAQPPLKTDVYFPTSVLPLAPTVTRARSAVSSPLAQASISAKDLSVALMGNPTPQEKRELWGRHGPDVVYGNIKIGSMLEDLGRMQLRGFGRDTKQVLLSNKNRNNPLDMGFDFKSICTFTEYQSYMTDATTQYLGSGYIVPCPEAQENYDSMAHLLACHVSVAILFASQFTMIIWPAHSSVWGVLEEHLPPVPSGAVLRFAIREAIPQWLTDGVKIERALRDEVPEQYESIKVRIDDSPAQLGHTKINVIFRDMFDIDFDRLIASNGAQRHPPAKNFFLCFHPANCENYIADESKRQALRWRASEEHDFFVEFLRANGAVNIYSMQDIGSYEITNKCSWDYFVNNVKSGAIIVHESCGRLDQLPHLAKVLRHQGAINVWKMSLAPMDQETEKHPHLVRLFPHGGVICLTPSLILYHPYEALRILKWFRLFHLPSKPSGIWKIAVRPRIREWLLDIQDLSCKATEQTPFGFPLQVYADIYIEIWIFLTRLEEPFGLMVETWDPEVPLRQAPLVSGSSLPRGSREWTGDTFETAGVDHEAIRWNDEETIQWFSEWAGLRLDEHRKFHVVLGYPKGHEIGDYVTKCYQKGYGFLDHGPAKPGKQELGLFWERNYLDIMSYEKCFEFHNVKDQATIDKVEADHRQKVRDGAARELAEAEKERKTARQAAKESLELVMQMCRDQGGTEEQARAAGRRRLLWKRDEQGAATDKEVEECAIDMDRVTADQIGWHIRIIAGTPEERAQAKKEQDKELLRLADKERLSGTQERERLWDAEIEMWAARDRARNDEDYEMTDAGDQELAENVYSKVLALEPELASKLTGMLLQLENPKLLALLQDDHLFRGKIKEAKALFLDFIETDEAIGSGEAEEWAPALKAYHAAEARRAAETGQPRKRSSELGTPNDGSFEEGELRAGCRSRTGPEESTRERGERKRVREGSSASRSRWREVDDGLADRRYWSQRY